MKIRALVAKMDGVPDSSGTAFLPGSIRGGRTVPLTRNFDPSRPPIGMATISVDGTDVYAEIEIDESANGLFPAVGGRAAKTRTGDFAQFEVMEISLCNDANQDPRIPALMFR